MFERVLDMSLMFTISFLNSKFEKDFVNLFKSNGN